MGRRESTRRRGEKAKRRLEEKGQKLGVGSQMTDESRQIAADSPATSSGQAGSSFNSTPGSTAQVVSNK